MESSIYYRESTGLLQIALESPGCRFKKAGSCTMCDYGLNGQRLTAGQAADVVRSAFEQYPEPRAVLLGSYGSVLDDEEVDREALIASLSVIAIQPVKNVFIETHYETIRPGDYHLLKRLLSGKNITLEMGLESVNSASRERINKKISLPGLKHTVFAAQREGIHVALNVLYGIPGLAVNEQQRDLLDTVTWALKQPYGANEVVVFPINVKKSTPLYELYRRGEYQLPRHEDMLSILRCLSNEELSKLYFSWYGDLQLAGHVDAEGAIPPETDLPQDELMDFYGAFMREKDGAARRELLNNLLQK